MVTNIVDANAGFIERKIQEPENRQKSKPG